jgi:PAS domain S-box-containing protein
MHRLLKRQLKKLFGESIPNVAELNSLIQLVDESYNEYQQDYNKLERILELSSKESFKELSNFKNAIDTAALVSLTDANANIIMANENFCKISGYPLNELVGKNHNIINSGFHPVSFFNNMWETIGSGKIWQGEICNRTKTGELYWVASTIIPFLNDEGVPYQYLSIRFDITSRKKIEEEIKTLALVAQKAQNVVIISDASGNAIWANDGFERITEFKVSDLLGKKPGTLLQGPETDPETIKEISMALRNKEPFTGEILNYAKSGRTYWISLSITPLIEEGKHIGFIAIESDITSRKIYEDRLKENEKLLRAINEASAELLANANFETAVGKSLEIIGKAFGVYRVHVFRNHKNERGEISSFSQKFHWLSTDNSVFINKDSTQILPFKDFGLERWVSELSNNKCIKGFVHDFPIEEKAKLIQEDLETIIALPIFIQDEFWGFLSLDSKDARRVWEDNHEQILRNVAGNIASSIERNNTELKLKESEEKFRLLIESATDIFYYTDSFGNFTYVNDIATQITGFSNEELLQMNYLDLVESTQRSMVETFYRKQSILGNKVTYYEFPITTKNGKVAWIGQNVQLIETGDDRRGIQAIARDITSLKNAQLEIENSHNFLNEIMEAIPNPMFVKNRKHEWIMVNDAYTALTGIPKNNILGNKDTSFLNKKDALSFIEIDEEQFQSTIETVREVDFVDVNGVNKILLVKKTIFSNRDEQFLIALITDISELKEREKEILLYNKISDQISDAISVADYTGKLIYVNEAHARNLGKPKEELIGSSIVEMEKIFPDLKSWQVHYDKIKKSGGSLVEGSNIKSDGTSFPVEANVKYVNIENKGYIVAAIRDITERKKAETKMLESENRFRSLVQNATDITTVLAATGEVTYESPSFYRAFGYEEREVLGRAIFEFVHPNDLERTYTEFIKGVTKGGISDPIQFRFRKKDGNYVTIETIGNNLINEPGIQGIVLNSRDISERIRAEEEVRILKEFYENVLNKIPTDVVVFDKNHKYLFINEIAVKDPAKRKWLIGKDDFEYCIHFGKKLEIAQNRRKLFDKVIESKAQFEFEEKITNPEGKTSWVLRRFYPVLDKNRDINNIIGFGIDITNRKEAEESVKESEERLEEAQHIAKVGGWEIDAKERFVKWSKEVYNLFEIDETLEPTLNETYQLFTRETRPAMIGAFNNALKNHQEFEIEGQVTTHKGKRMDVRTKGIPYVRNGRIVSIKGIFQDITQEKEATRLMHVYTEELEKKNKELDQFAYVVSHDLKAPLRGINNLSMWIEEDMEGKLEPDTQNNLDLMRKRVKRMEGLIDGILQYSRAGRIRHEKVQFNLKVLLEELVNGLSPSENTEIVIQPDLPVMETEKIAIEQVFANYISNAIKYNNNPSPRIEISSKQNGNYYEFCVADNGPGIEKEFHEKVFVIFQTLQSRDTYESTGVGLAIVKKMVEDKGGKVWIESEPGNGSKFFFSWPLTELDQ